MSKSQTLPKPSSSPLPPRKRVWVLTRVPAVVVWLVAVAMLLEEEKEEEEEDEAAAAEEGTC
jgi:hypothetical protein